jgi:stage II sporulation protein M
LGWMLAHRAGLESASTLHPPALGFWTILGRNVAVVLGLAGGVLSFGLVTVAVLVINGAVVGAAAHVLVAGNVGAVMWSGLAPHAVPEVGALVIAAAADLWLAAVVARWLMQGSRPVRYELVQRWLVPHFVVLGLLVTAALLEAQVSAIR